jgi:hypothetical protein
MIEEKRMSDALKQNLPPGLAAKIEALAGSITPEDVAQMQHLAQERSHAAGDAGGAKGSAPAAVLEKLNAFAESLSPEETALAQAMEQALATEVQGYLGTVIPSMYGKDKGPSFTDTSLWNLMVQIANGTYGPASGPSGQKPA